LQRTDNGKKTWGPAHMNWLMAQKLEHREQRIAFEELLEGMRQEEERVQRLEEAIRDAVPEWSLAEVATALQAVRGIDQIAAVAVLAELGDLSRFRNPRELMGYLGVVPSESSTGDTVKRGGITKVGNGRARRILVEAAWSYRYPPRVSREKQPKVAAAPRRVREIAWKAQATLCGCFRSLERKGKRRTVIVTAIARELSAFIWAINCEIMGARQSVTSPEAVDRSSRAALNRPTASALQSRSSGTTAGGIPDEDYVADHLIDARIIRPGQPQTKNGNAVSNPRIRARSPTSSGPALTSARSISKRLHEESA
jgi:transposase IS116/IS110/IS902 family protein